MTGFDYSGNFVFDDPSSSTNPFGGKKLVVEITLERADGFFGGKNVPTNTNDSGIYYPDDGGMAKAFDVPTVDVPLIYAYETQNVYRYITEDVSMSDLLSYVSGYVPNGTNNAFADIAYTFANGSDTYVYTIPRGTAASSGTWQTGNNRRLHPPLPQSPSS